MLHTTEQLTDLSVGLGTLCSSVESSCLYLAGAEAALGAHNKTQLVLFLG